MNAEIITIGGELLSGLVVDTNSAFLGKELSKIGIQVDFRTSIADVKEHMVFALGQALSRAKVVIITGGLGPTHDDITKKTLVEFFNTELVQDEKALSMVQERFLKFGYKKMPESNYEQALVPKSAKVIYNGAGTAQGSHFTEKGVEIFSVPGVPREMRWMFDNYIRDFLNSKTESVITYRTLKTAGIGESLLWEILGDSNELFPNLEVASLPHAFGVDIRFKAKTNTQKKAEELLDQAEKIVLEKVGKNVFAKDEESLPQTIIRICKEQGLKIALAESCTGGLIAKLLTDISGSSEIFWGGVNSYSNESKIKFLSVKPETLDEFGAVSEEVVTEMSKGILDFSEADFGIAVTGISGPTGGTEEKPVGTTWISVASKNGIKTKKFNFLFDRADNRVRAANNALEMLRREITGI